MFVRFRKSSRRLDVSLAETRRVNGKILQEHVASLGSITVPPSVADRIVFWQRLHGRLAKLSNRIDAEKQAKILGSVFAKIPMPSADEQRMLQLENAKEDARQWSSVRDMHAGTAEDHKGLAAMTATAIASSEAAATNADANAKMAQERVERIERGEIVDGGFSKPATLEDYIAALGPKVVRQCQRIHELVEARGREEIFDEIWRRKNRAEEATIRAMYKKYFG
jgi:hypothetical protein